MTSSSARHYQREYRPRQVIYLPIFFYRLRKSIRAGSPMYIYDTNPGMPPAGLLAFSKWYILQQIPEHHRPSTIYIDPSQDNNQELQHIITKLGGLPLIAKPDVGERGVDVRLLETEDELEQYIHHASEPIVLQSYIDYPIELGIMRHRYPGEEQGHVTSITMKAYPQITGDGEHTITELIHTHPRYHRYEDYLLASLDQSSDYIPPSGVSIALSVIGNHAKGATFINGNHLITSRLEEIMTQIAEHIEGFSYGRFDLKIPSLASLDTGQDICILEVNGIQSEPAHIYDSRTSLGHAYESLFHHRHIMYTIAKRHRQDGRSMQLGLLEHLRHVLS